MNKLCKECEYKKDCLKPCQESIDFDKLDTSTNYMAKGEYKATGVQSTWSEVRMGGGISRFK